MLGDLEDSVRKLYSMGTDPQHFIKVVAVVPQRTKPKSSEVEIKIHLELDLAINEDFAEGKGEFTQSRKKREKKYYHLEIFLNLIPLHP